MIVFPECKINLGLNVIAKRDDGYHDIETVMFPVPFYDILEALPLEESTAVLQITGQRVPGRDSENLVVKAYHLLKKDYDLPGMRFHLHKVIPPGSGLGGGSSDGASALMMLNAMFSLAISGKTLSSYGEQLGSDCPFFIRHQPFVATGRGNVLEPLNLRLEGYLALVIPLLQINTGDAYRAVMPGRRISSLRNVISRPVNSWKDILINDFEEVIFPDHPVLKSIKNELYEAGAIYASMSGSGSALYGLFSELPHLTGRFADCLVWYGKL